MSRTTRLAALVPSLSLGERDRRALYIGGSVLLLLLGWTRIARPAIAQLGEGRRTLAEQRALLARERSLVAAAPQLPAAQRAADRALAGETSRLFVGDSVGATAELTSYVADVATESEVRLTSVEARASSASAGVTRLLVDARGEGSWSQVLDFVAALESSEQLVDLPNVRIERGARPGAAGGSTVTVAVTVAGYARSTR
jgi:hypothetical protein